jgi:uncharacterized protein YwqG
MSRVAYLNLKETAVPLTEHCTKFGGHPVWLTDPQWPLSKTIGAPMQFICQIRLEEELFGQTSAKMAYIFIDSSPKSASYDAFMGDNAIILQPGKCLVSVESLNSGPTISKRVKGPRKFLFHTTLQVPCEYEVSYEYSDEPELKALDRLWDEDEMAADAIITTADRTKLGGTPIFVQDKELPISDPWHLLLQLNTCDVPFYLRLGDGGVIYAFVNSGGTEARMLWQCY